MVNNTKQDEENDEDYDDEAQLTYNEKAKNLVMGVPSNDFSHLYSEAVINYTEGLDDDDFEELDCVTLMESIAEIHAEFFAEYILDKTLNKEDSEKIFASFNKSFNFYHLQNILNALDAGCTIDQYLNNDCKLDDN